MDMIGLMRILFFLHTSFYKKMGFLHIPKLDDFRPDEVDPTRTEQFRADDLTGPVGYRFTYYMFKNLK